MRMMRNSKTLLALFALLLILGACKGESPTAPAPGGGIPGGGNPNPTPTGIDVTLTSTNANPLVDSSVTITATVTQNGQPAPNGTAVEFATTRGSFDSTSSVAVIKTTANGVATVTLTSTTAGLARVTAIVNNVQRSIDVTFQTRPVTPPPPNTTPTISSVTPAIGRPAGGETIRITGTNFRTPVRVLFDIGAALPVEATVVAVTPTTIDVITPGVNITVTQELIADIIVLTEAGTAAEQRVELTGGFTYRNERLTPQISTATPNSGPITGGTIVTLFGDGFQEPVQVLFGAAEARVISVDFSKIMVEAPAGRDTSDAGNVPVTGFVPIVVRNINSQTEDSLGDAFRYVNGLQITAVGPTEGPFTGGTRVEIDGTGFVGPVAVSIGGVAAQPIFVSGTKVIAITSGVALAACADQPGPVVVTNISNGDTTTATTPFIFRVLRPAILTVSPSATLGGSITIVVANAIGTPRLRLGSTNLSISNAVVNSDGTTTFTAVVPTTLPLTTEACPGLPGVSRRLPTAFDVVYTSLTTTCTDTLQQGATIVPVPNTPVIALSPATGFGPFTAAITPGTPGDPAAVPPVPPTPATVAPSAGQSVAIANSGTGTLVVNSVTPGAGCTNFTVSAPPTPANVETCDAFTVSAVYRGTTTPGTEQCTVTVSTNAGTRTLTLSGTSQ
ncbi:MAG: hypothetical protein QOJ98_1871 [Acidobacteriota bacterium]|jgi:hypothetical protein|nr:hypothetical protein [Acidobacteriota bacterium]